MNQKEAIPTDDSALDESVLRDSAAAFCAKSAPVNRLRKLRGKDPAYSTISGAKWPNLAGPACWCPNGPAGWGWACARWR